MHQVPNSEVLPLQHPAPNLGPHHPVPNDQAHYHSASNHPAHRKPLDTFGIIDTNGDGVIDRSEWNAHMQGGRPLAPPPHSGPPVPLGFQPLQAPTESLDFQKGKLTQEWSERHQRLQRILHSPRVQEGTSRAEAVAQALRAEFDLRNRRLQEIMN